MNSFKYNGIKVHTTKRKGMYTVKETGNKFLLLCTKSNPKGFWIHVSQLLDIAGGHHNTFMYQTKPNVMRDFARNYPSINSNKLDSVIEALADLVGKVEDQEPEIIDQDYEVIKALPPDDNDFPF